MAAGLRWEGDIVAGRVLKPFIASSSKADKVHRLDETLDRSLEQLDDEDDVVDVF